MKSTILSLFLTIMLSTSLCHASSFSFDFMSDLHFWEDRWPEEALALSSAQILKEGPGDFLVLGGDYDNFPECEKALERLLLKPARAEGKPYPCVVLVGNHDPAGTANQPQANPTRNADQPNIAHIIERNKSLPFNLKHGPASRSIRQDYQPDGAKWTTFSFDYQNCHFIVLDVYPVKMLTVDDALIDWVEQDLQATTQPMVFVFCHQPLKFFHGVEALDETPQPISLAGGDMPRGDCERLWKAIKADSRVVAFVCGHTHLYGIVQDGNLWQVCADREWTASRMFIKFFVDGEHATARVFWWQEATGKYQPVDLILR
ncbi:MAG: metallophosphoesterase [Victivallales bacterium]|nr:metallophosphoesterase [Victivallales bacterium]